MRHVDFWEAVAYTIIFFGYSVGGGYAGYLLWRKDEKRERNRNTIDAKQIR